ncbi:SDR family oxidoreductase [Pseudoalteromonas ruthenica]|uniref:SDR family oxidoreductase n=1 Tax=Pseudoalteromonas ruthenica TaxID=151081 RepID=UPI00034B3DAD|nr:SDR family oxidoreductase [Pseudoalteromonas ruthenica]
MNKHTVLVTGASRGIGAATARLLAEQGYQVVINYLKNHRAAHALVAEIEQGGGVALAVAGDVSQESEVERLFATIDEHCGGLTHLVNNVGILAAQTSLAGLNAQRINRILSVNVTSAFLCAQAALLRMPDNGAIVNVSSAAARTGAPFEYLDYAASKGAMDSFTIGLAKEVAARGIRVNGVRPGVIATDIHGDGGEPERVHRLGPQLPLGRCGYAHEVAQAIAWLLGEQASFTTGTFIDVSGGA